MSDVSVQRTDGARKAPTWAMVVGILGLCFGALGLLGGTYELMMPMMMSMQK